MSPVSCLTQETWVGADKWLQGVRRHQVGLPHSQLCAQAWGPCGAPR